MELLNFTPRCRVHNGARGLVNGGIELPAGERRRKKKLWASKTH